MVFWYRNSILASIVSIVGCVTVIVGIGAIRSGELGVGQAVLVIAVGVLLAIIGWWISDRKRKKQIEKARMEQNRKNQEISSQNSGNTSYQRATQRRIPDIGPSVNTSDTAGDESQDQIRFCSKCGAGLVSGALFCSSCGVKIQPPKAKRQKDDAQKEEQSKQKLEDIFQKAGEYREKGDYQKELDILLTGLTIDEKILFC